MMTQFEQIEIVVSIIKQFNGEIREADIKRLFDEQMTEYNPQDLSEDSLHKLIQSMLGCGLLTSSDCKLLTYIK